MTSDLLTKIEKTILELPKGLQGHITRTRNLACDIASFYSVDISKCDTAAAAHDIVRHLTPDELLNCAKHYLVEINELYRKQPILLHGPLAAKIIEVDYFCKDNDIISAVKFHTTGRPNMGDIEKVVFIADKIEPMKIKKNPSLKPVEELIYKDINLAIKEYLSIRFKMLLNSNSLIDPLAVDTWNNVVINKSFD
jgi:predicted HD superfamily hydrolase involved in NAD metabolism